MTDGQTYANHAHQPRSWLLAWLLAVLGEVLVLAAVFTSPLTLMSVGVALLGGAVVLGVTITRQYALRLQNRIIRAEMQTRLARLGRVDVLARVTMPQLVALRFASDLELPALIDRTLAERLTPDQIKRAVTDWQGDYLRT
jgi:hypothetical protein